MYRLFLADCLFINTDCHKDIITKSLMFFNSVTSFNFGTKPIVIRFQEFSRLHATIA